MTIIIFLIVLAVLIFVHEFGHFLAARACGIRVDSFKIGFGPKIFSWHFKNKDGTPGETEYGINWIPFGGYVKIFGENPDEQSLDAQGKEASRSFALKARWKQAIVLAAGVLFNFIFAWLLYVAVFTTGVTVSTDSFPQYADRYQNQRIMITDVLPGSPADKAGLQAGDTVDSITDPYAHAYESGGVIIDFPGYGNDIYKAFASSSEVLSYVQSSIDNTGADFVAEKQQQAVKNQTSPIDLPSIQYHRGNEVRSTPIVPITGLVPGKYAIGIAMDNAANLKLPVWTSTWVGLQYTGELIKETVVGLYTFVANIFRGMPDFSQVAGPVGIAGIVGNAAELGFTYLVMITAIISINLGVVNLIPFPALDGGRILFVAIEGIIRRRISPRFTNAVNMVGFVLLMLLMVAVTYRDIAKLVR